MFEMDMIKEAYAEFGRLMVEEKIYLDLSLDYGELCHRLGVESYLLDELLLDELGMTGEELIAVFRREG